MKILRKSVWLLPPLLIATVLALRVKTDERVSPESIPLKETPVISRALRFIEKNYVDPQVIHPDKMLKSATRELERQIPPLRIRLKEKALEVHLGGKMILMPLAPSVTLEDVTTLLGRLLGFLDVDFKGRPDEKDRLSLVLDGVMETLDPHSNYLSPKVYAEFKIGTKGNFGGLGIVIGLREGELTVISPLEGTPAFEAGIKSRDKIVQIGQESTINMGLTEAVEKLRGPIGSTVSVTINRTGMATPLKFTLTRALIRIQSVAGKVLDNKKTILLKIKNFQEDTMDQLKKTLRSFDAGGVKPDGLIVDLRNNPGGLLDQAVAMADFFLEKGTIVKTVGTNGETLDLERASPGDEGEKYPLLVLVNEGSASASEIIAGALQLNDRAVVIGNRTFGKGSVQTVYDLKNGSALKLTIAKYLTARDQEVQSIGINPDVGLVPATVNDKIVDVFEDVKRRELDLQERERDEEESQKAAALPSPALQMTYLSAEKAEEESTGRIELQNDLPVQLAERILELPESKSLDRQYVLKALTGVLETSRKEERRKIQKAMSDIGVDWSPASDDRRKSPWDDQRKSPGDGEKKGHPIAAVSLEVTDDKGNARKGLSAGESGFVRVTVENKGGAPFSELAGVTKSEDPIFANLEFPFGRIDPQQKKTWKRPIKIPDFASRRSIPVEIDFHEEFDRIPRPSIFSLEVEEPPMPHFQYLYSLEDGGIRDTIGNENHKAERGETIGLSLKIKNTGSGEGRAPVVNLKNLDGEEDFIEKGHIELAPLPPGKEAEATVLFRISRKGQADKLSFDLAIMDNHLGEELTDHLVIPLSAIPSDPAPATLQSDPILRTDPGGPPLISKGSSYKIRGTAEDDQGLKNVFIFVGDEKVFYQAANPKDKKMNFEATVSLKKGPNLITLSAQDNRDLTGRRQWIVWRNK